MLEKINENGFNIFILESAFFNEFLDLNKSCSFEKKIIEKKTTFHAGILST